VDFQFRLPISSKATPSPLSKYFLRQSYNDSSTLAKTAALSSSDREEQEVKRQRTREAKQLVTGLLPSKMCNLKWAVSQLARNVILISEVATAQKTIELNLITTQPALDVATKLMITMKADPLSQDAICDTTTVQLQSAQAAISIAQAKNAIAQTVTSDLVDNYNWLKVS
jgi:hypothetical protein